MTNNDVLRRIRYIFDFDDSTMISVFTAAEHQVTREQVSSWLKQDDAEGFEKINDSQLAVFLNGLINNRRGKKDGEQAAPEQQLNNNIIFRKLKIALNLQAQDILALLLASEKIISKHELSAFFRNAEHKHYRVCNDQVLRAFLNGLRLKYRKSSV